jgi:UPF0176 protein
MGWDVSRGLFSAMVPALLRSSASTELKHQEVTISKVLLLYAFTLLADPEAIRLWQRDSCESLGLTGRILISPRGLKGTLGGELNSLKCCLRKTCEYPAFENLDAKFSIGTGNDFPGSWSN